MTNKQKQWMEKIPQIYQANYKKAIDGKSKAAAVKAKCLDCCCWQRTEIADCLVDTCPLWPYRPYRNAEKLRITSKSGTLANEKVGGYKR